MPFHILPNEVVSEIFFQIEDRSTLYSLSLCSHRIHEIVEPVLYNVFEDTRPLDLVLFLRTILQNPRLGFHVRKFDARDRRFAILPAGRGRGALRTALPPVPQEPAFYLGCFEQDDWSRLCMIFFYPSVPHARYFYCNLNRIMRACFRFQRVMFGTAIQV
jgi:hypothetical protein